MIIDIYIYYAVCMYLLYKEEIKTTTTNIYKVHYSLYEHYQYLQSTL